MRIGAVKRKVVAVIIERYSLRFNNCFLLPLHPANKHATLTATGKVGNTARLDHI